MTIYPTCSEIADKFVRAFDHDTQFSLISSKNGTLLRFAFKNQKFIAYFKSVTYAGHPYPADRTRAQLPKREDFDSIGDDELFFFLGYDVENDLFVCWDPTKVKARLNKKSYVSFFCRKDVQESVKEGIVKTATLSNGDIFALFKRNDAPLFLENISSLFPSLSVLKTEYELANEDYTKNDIPANEEVGVLSEIEKDEDVKHLVDSLKERGYTPMSIISECCNTFSHKYNKMLFKEWANLVRSYLPPAH